MASTRLTSAPARTGRAGPVLIDLGVLEPAGPDRSDTGPGSPGAGRPAPSRRWPAALAALAVAALMLTTDTAPADRPVTVSAAGTPVDVVADTLFVTEADGAGLSAYSLRTGRRRWTVGVPAFTQADVLAAGRDVLLVSWEQAATVAVDAGTGRIRWRRAGTPVWSAPSGDRVALMSQAMNAAGNRFSVTVVATATGRGDVRFSGAGSVGPVYSADPRAGRVAGVFVRDDAAGGRIFDFAADRVRPVALAAGTPPPPLPPQPGQPLVVTSARPQYEELLLAGDHTLRVSFWGSRRELSGYPMGGPPDPGWTLTGLGLVGQAWWCGGAVCTSDGTQAFAVEPATGALRWRSGWGLLWPAGAGRALAANSVGVDGGGGIAVIDESNGRELLRREAWRPLTQTSRVRVPILVYRRSTVVVGVLDTRRLTARRLAVVPASSHCWSDDTYVVCRGAPQTYRAWRYSS